MAGTIVVDRLESDASYASSINIASPIVISNTITGNVNFDSGTLFVDSVGNKVGIGTTTPNYELNIRKAGQTNLSLYNSSNAVELRLISDSAGAYVQTNTNHPLWFATNNGAVQMAIDTSGRVTMPYQPYIIAARTGSNFTTDGSTPIQFNTILNQVGITASNSNSRFTVPVAGTYLICFNWFLTNPSNLDNAMTVLVNGTEIYRFGANSNGLSGTPSNYGDGAAQMYYFNANDYVDFRGSGSKTVLGTNPYHTTVSIGKIY